MVYCKSTMPRELSIGCAGNINMGRRAMNHYVLCCTHQIDSHRGRNNVLTLILTEGIDLLLLVVCGEKANVQAHVLSHSTWLRKLTVTLNMNLKDS